MTQLRPRHRLSRTCHGHATGFVLASVSVYLIVLSILAAIGINRVFNEFQDKRALAYAGSLIPVQEAVNGYIVRYFGQLTQGQPVTFTRADGTSITVTNRLRPTVQNLIDMGLLRDNFRPTSSVNGGSFLTSLSIVSCPQAPAQQCVDGIAYINRPLMAGNTVDGARLGMAIRELGPDGGFSTTMVPAQISFLVEDGNATPSLPNPVVNQPAGILAARVGVQSARWSELVRRDGSLPMTGALTVKPQGAANPVVTINADGNASNSGNVAAGGDVSAASNLSAAGNVSAAGGDATAGTRVTAGNHLFAQPLGKTSTQLDASPESCADVPGGAMRPSNDGVLYSCQSGQWQRSGGVAETGTIAGGGQYVQYDNGLLIQWGTTTEAATVNLKDYGGIGYSVSLTRQTAPQTLACTRTVRRSGAGDAGGPAPGRISETWGVAHLADCAVTVASRSRNSFSTTSRSGTSTALVRWMTVGMLNAGSDLFIGVSNPVVRRGNPVTFEVVPSQPLTSGQQLSLDFYQGTATEFPPGADFETYSFEISVNNGASWTTYADTAYGKWISFPAGTSRILVRTRSYAQSTFRQIEDFHLRVATGATVTWGTAALVEVPTLSASIAWARDDTRTEYSTRVRWSGWNACCAGFQDAPLWVDTSTGSYVAFRWSGAEGSGGTAPVNGPSGEATFSGTFRSFRAAQGPATTNQGNVNFEDSNDNDYNDITVYGLYYTNITNTIIISSDYNIMTSGSGLHPSISGCFRMTVNGGSGYTLFAGGVNYGTASAYNIPVARVRNGMYFRVPAGSTVPSSVTLTFHSWFTNAC